MKSSPVLTFAYTGLSYDEGRIFELIASSGVLDVVMPGDKVLIKPNWVQEHHEKNDSWEQMVTHPAVITAVVRIVLARLDGEGSVVIADSPMTPAHFDRILEHMPVAEWESMCADEGIRLSILDLRDERWDVEDGIIITHHVLPGDPKGCVRFDLEDRASEFYGKAKPAEGFFGASYDVEETNRAHDGYHNEYEMARSAIECDVFVNLPKVKAHRKAGMTCSLKNLVGVSTNKNLIPHHSAGGPKEGGDQFSDDGGARKLEGGLTRGAKAAARNNPLVARALVPLKKIARVAFGDNRMTVRNGSWWGNDTLWRSIVDLNKLLMYGNPDGTLRADSPASMKRYVSIADGIVCGEGEGPLEPDPKDGGFIVCGTNAVAVDCAVARLSGFDWEKVPSIHNSFESSRYRIAHFNYGEIICSINGADEIALAEIDPVVRLLPAAGWVGHLETR